MTSDAFDPRIVKHEAERSTPPTLEQIDAQVRAGIAESERQIEDWQREVSNTRSLIKNARAVIAELKRRLPRKPLKAKLSNE